MAAGSDTAVAPGGTSSRTNRAIRRGASMPSSRPSQMRDTSEREMPDGVDRDDVQHPNHMDLSHQK